MEFSNNFLGGYFTGLINIKQFKTENAFSPEHNIRMSKIKDSTILSKLSSINPDIDISNITNEMNHCNAILENYNFQEIFESPETLSARHLLPIYNNVSSDLCTLKVPKTDLYQNKRTKLYVPPPTFTPRGNIVPGKTLLITISLYYPFHLANNKMPDEAVVPRCKETIQFYDTQTLRHLKQAFKCENVDSEISGDISENPYKPLEFIMNSDLKQSLFYINNTIYVDSLQPGITLTHAETMKEWALNNGHQIQDILSMDTQLLDLKIRIGEPYIYQHLGRCEHLFIFNEISFAQSNDCLGQTNFPRVVSMMKEKIKNCILCDKSLASIVMLSNDVRTPVTVNHICENCFISFNYDHFGEKLSNFKAYRILKWRK